MTKTIIFAIVLSAGLIASGFGVEQVFGEGFVKYDGVEGESTAQAIPDWVNNNFKWYGEGLIEQTDLLNSLAYLLDNGHMFLSDKAAQEMQSLREENTAFKKKLATDGIVGPNTSTTSSDEQGRVKVQFNWDMVTEQELLTHLGKTYDLNQNLETKVVQFDKDHDKWIDVLSIDWGSSSTTQGDPDRPVIVGRIYNTETTGDRPTEKVSFYYNKITFAYDVVDDIVTKGGTTSAWEDGIDQLSSNQGENTIDSVVDDLQGIVVLCSTAIDKEILKIEAEVAVLGELHDRLDDSTARSGSTTQYGESDLQFIQRHAAKIDTKILSLQTGLSVLEEKLATIGDDSQLANVDLQSTLQKQQQTLQMLSSITKSMHDTAMTTIRSTG